MFSHILAPLDGSRLAECVFPHLIQLAKTFNSRCTLLRVMEVAPVNNAATAPPPDPVSWNLRRAKVEKYLEKAARRLQSEGVEVEYEILDGSAPSWINDFAQRENIDLIILSSHGRSGLGAWNVSSVALKIIQTSYRSTMIVRASHEVQEQPVHYKRILVPLDGSQRAEYALSTAAALASHFEAELLLVHVVGKPEIPRRAPLNQEEQGLVRRLTELNRGSAKKYLKRIASQLPVPAQTHLYENNDVMEALQKHIAEAGVDLVVLCAHGYSGKEQPLGSVPTNFILYGNTPLLILQDLSPGFENSSRGVSQEQALSSFERR